MIHQITNSYFTLLLAIGLGTLVIVVGGLYVIYRPRPRAAAATSLVVKNSQKKPLPRSDRTHPTPIKITSHDISAIAGGDILSTQLDLARAYIEAGRTHLAMKILTHVVEQGSVTQQNEAQQLLELM